MYANIYVLCSCWQEEGCIKCQHSISFMDSSTKVPSRIFISAWLCLNQMVVSHYPNGLFMLYKWFSCKRVFPSLWPCGKWWRLMLQRRNLVFGVSEDLAGDVTHFWWIYFLQYSFILLWKRHQKGEQGAPVLYELLLLLWWTCMEDLII